MTWMKRSVINPVMLTAGGLTGVSGFFLMFHYESHFTKALHQVGGILLLVFAVMHLRVNHKALANSLKKRFPLWAGALFALCAGIMASGGVHAPHGLRVLQKGLMF